MCFSLVNLRNEKVKSVGVFFENSSPLDILYGSLKIILLWESLILTVLCSVLNYEEMELPVLGTVVNPQV